MARSCTPKALVLPVDDFYAALQIVHKTKGGVPYEFSSSEICADVIVVAEGEKLALRFPGGRKEVICCEPLGFDEGKVLTLMTFAIKNGNRVSTRLNSIHWKNILAELINGSAGN